MKDTEVTHRRGTWIDYARAPRQFLQDYFWIILKNVVGWILILAAWPIGLIVPGPGGIPIFLIGFAMVTFPGKRRLTARVLRGRRMQIQARVFTLVSGFVALAVPAIILGIIYVMYEEVFDQRGPGWLLSRDMAGIYLLIIAVTWLVARIALVLVNVVIKGIPKVRRRVRPWLRSHGINLLPPRRRRKKLGLSDAPDDQEILEFHERHHNRIRFLWATSKPWIRRAVALAITVLIFVWIIKPITRQWSELKDEILSTSVWRFVVASMMFAVFLLLFRAITWWRILIGLNHRLPVAAATRIWSVSELARYLPGVVWQVVGRVYMVRPYGVNALTSSTSQLVEIAIFLVANLIVAILFLVGFGASMQMESHGWYIAALVIVPLLLVLLHPKVFHGVIDAILRLMKKPPMPRRLSGRLLVGLLGWAMLGVLWQSLAVWVLLGQPQALALDISQLWLVAGAYCLAWSAGFMAFWAPGGIGVREVVLIATLKFALPDIAGRFAGDQSQYYAFLGFLSLMLRLWTVAGELLLTGIAYLCDLEGALRQPVTIEEKRPLMTEAASAGDIERP